MYNINSMYEHVVRLSRYHRMMWWTQDEIFGPRNTPHFWLELSTFCWLVYSKALNSKGPAYIGRIADMQKIKLHICNFKPSGLGILDAHAKGNVLSSPKWAPVLNDAWIIGHIHRKAEFILVSPRSPQNLWEQSPYRTGVTITAREIIGLTAFGYIRKADTYGNTVFSCNNIYYSNNADLIKYSEVMDRDENKKMRGIIDFIGLNNDLMNSITNRIR